MAALALVRDNLQKDLLGLQEEELELNDEFEGVSELLAVQRHRSKMPGNAGAKAAEAMAQPSGATGSSRRKKAALFLPSEHDELPPGVAFMTLANHTAPITSLDFSEPYGTLVSSALDDSVRVWDLSSGAEVGRLRGHSGTVKCLQVEDELCITGGVDSSVRLWDLHRVEDYEARLSIKANSESKAGGGIIKQGGESNGGGDDDDDDEGGPSAKGNGADDRDKEHDPCLRSLEGHSKAVTSLYFDDTCLVTGASDKTLRQWDLNTGQCVLTMDILWAISNPTSSQSLMPDPTPSSDEILGSPVRDRNSRSSLGGSSSVPGSRIASGAAPLMADKNFSGPFSYPTPAFADGSWEMYQDFVGGVQFWGYALASGSGDGAVRMWDMRTGQAHRTLHGHTGPVTSLQFDETHVVSASLDRSVRIWDLRTGAISETIRFDYPVTDVQFDSRKIVAATGENQVKVRRFFSSFRGIPVLLWLMTMLGAPPHLADFQQDLAPDADAGYQWPHVARRKGQVHGPVRRQRWQGPSRQGLGTVETSQEMHTLELDSHVRLSFELDKAGKKRESEREHLHFAKWGSRREPQTKLNLGVRKVKGRRRDIGRGQVFEGQGREWRLWAQVQWTCRSVPFLEPTVLNLS